MRVRTLHPVPVANDFYSLQDNSDGGDEPEQYSNEGVSIRRPVGLLQIVHGTYWRSHSMLFLSVESELQDQEGDTAEVSINNDCETLCVGEYMSLEAGQ